MKYIYSFLALLILPILVEAQQLVGKQQNTQDKKENFFEIRKAFNDYWAPFNVQDGYYTVDGQKIKASGWKQFKRWEWYWETRINPQTGEFPDVTAADIYQQEIISDNSVNQNENWAPLGPTSSTGGEGGLGRINCIAFVPGRPNSLYVGSPSGGLWKTDNGGNDWEPKTDHEAVLGVSDIVVIPGATSESDVLYIATGDRDGGTLSGATGGGQINENNSIGVLKSIDGGTSWQSTGLSWNAGAHKIIYRLLLDPNNNNILYAASSDGIYKSINAGVSWYLLVSPPYAQKKFLDLVFYPDNSSILFGSTDEGEIFKLTNGGTYWELKLDTNLEKARIAIAISQDVPGFVYALVSDLTPGPNKRTLYGIYKSIPGPGGDLFVKIFDGLEPGNNLLANSCNGSNSSTYASNKGQGDYDLCIAVDPNNFNNVYIGGINTWKSVDGGDNWYLENYWNTLNPCLLSPQVVHADKHYLAFQPGTNDLFECNDGGVYKKENNSNSWNYIGSGLQTSQIYRLGVSQTNSEDVIIGLQDNGTKSHNSAVWSDVLDGDGGECIIDPQDNSTQYGSQQYGKIYRTTNGWTWPLLTYTEITVQDNDPTGFITPFVIDPNNHQTLYVGRSKIWKSTNKGNSWDEISGSFSSPIRSIAIAPSNSTVIYAATFQKIYMTTTSGGLWIDITGTLPVLTNSITYISVKNNDPYTIWVSLGQYNDSCVFEGKYNTQNNSISWTDISEGLPGIPIMCVIQNKQNISNTQLFAGTDLGVYTRIGNSEATVWQLYNNNLPNVVVTELEMYYNSDPLQSRLRAATYGRGLWETSVDFDVSGLVASPGNSLNYYDVVVSAFRDNSLKLINNGSVPIDISNMSISGLNADQYSIQGSKSSSIQPNQEMDITIRLLPTSSGSKEDTLVISSNSLNNPVLKVSLDGVGVQTATRHLLVQPDTSYNFGSLNISQSKTKSLRIMNIGSDTLTITNLSILGMDSVQYSIVSMPQLPLKLGTADTKFIKIKFTPSSYGVKTSNFVISCNDNQGSANKAIVLYGNGNDGILSSKILAYEYWFNSDYSQREYCSINPLHKVNLNLNIPTNNLPVGLHQIHFRFKDHNGRWGSIISQYFYKQIPKPEGAEINAYEYWFDDEYSSKHFITVPDTANLNLLDSIPTNTLTVGLHAFHIRFRDDQGAWGSILSQFFYKTRETTGLPNLVSSYRYWFDLDQANMVHVALPAPVNPLNLITEVSSCGLSYGNHSIHLQFKDEAGFWSSVFTDDFNFSSPVSPVITSSGATILCQGDSVTLTSTIAASYLWNTGATSQSIAVTEAGNYYLTVDAGCGTQLTSNTISVSILPTSGTVPGNVYGGSEILLGSSTGNLNLSGHTGIVVKWQKRLDGGPWQDIINTSATLNEIPTGIGNWDYRAMVQNGSCVARYSGFARVIVLPVTRTVNLQVFLQSLYSGGSVMRKAQNATGDQYADSIADLITIELRNADYFNYVEFSTGNINLHTSGSVHFSVSGFLHGSYYITVKHRNSITTTTAFPVSFDSEVINYNYNASSASYGNNMKFIEGNYCLYGGDVNQDGIIDSGDMIPVDNSASGFTTGYLPEDANGDGLVDASDMIIVDNNSSDFITEMLPPLPDLPFVTTDPVFINGNAHISGGNVLYQGSSPVTARGVCWDISPSPTVLDSHTMDGSGEGAYTSNLSSLLPSTTYYLRAYATNSLGTSYGPQLSFTTAITMSGNGVTDIDGNQYASVYIGSQEWMSENLGTARYSNGDPIPAITNNTQWTGLTSGAWCWYNNSNQYDTPYGKLYNWPAVNDIRNICPTGWHIPSDAEWTQLATYLGGTTIAGGKMKETSTSHWISPNTGATNESEFTGLPGGFRSSSNGSFSYMGTYGMWWSSTETTTSNAWSRFLTAFSAAMSSSSTNKNSGLSVRCIKD